MEWRISIRCFICNGTIHLREMHGEKRTIQKLVGKNVLEKTSFFILLLFPLVFRLSVL